MFDVIVVGRAVWVDWELPGDVEAEELDSFAGSGANAAVLLAGLGLRCGLVTSLGSDWRSERYERRLGELGVDLVHTQRRKEPMARCRVTREKKYEWVGDNIGSPQVDGKSIQDLFGRTEALLCSDMVPGLDADDLRGSCYWAPQLALRMHLAASLGAIGLPWRAVMLNASEARLLASSDGRGLRQISRDGPPGTVWITTNEASPTEILRRGVPVHYPVPVTSVTLSLGGGDAFAAGYCAAEVWGLDEGAAVALGHNLAKAVVSRLGCQLPIDDVEKIRHAARGRMS